MNTKEQILIVAESEEHSREYREMFSKKPEEVSIIRAESVAEAKNIIRRSMVDVLLLEPAVLRESAEPDPREIIETSDVRQNLSFVRAYIFRHYAEHLTAEGLAALVSVTPHYLGRMFRLKEGVGFKAFLENTRLERAAALLRGTDRTVCSIARSVGFCDAAYFCRRFRKAYGTTPTTYRKESRQKNDSSLSEDQ